MAARNQERFKDAASLGPTNRDDPRQATGAGSGLDADKLDGQHGAYYLARGNHTGSQAAATISDLPEAVQDIVGAMVANGANITITYDDPGGTLTIAVTGTLPAARMPAFSGDVASTAGSTVLTLATVNASPGPYGAANKTITATINGKGLATNFAETLISITASQVSDFSAAADARISAALAASPALGGTPTAPTAANVTSSTQIATTAFVHACITDLINASPATLDTLKELADAIGDDPNFATTVATSVATKLAKASNLSDLTNFATARTNLGVAIGSNVQAWSAALDVLASLTATTDNFIVSVGSAWASRTPAQVRTTLGLVIGTNVQAYSTNLTTWAGIAPASGVGTFLGAPSSANLLSAMTDKTGTGLLVFGTAPTISAPTITGGFTTAKSVTSAGDAQEIGRFERSGGTATAGHAGRTGVLAIVDSNNPTVVAGIGGRRTNPGVDYTGSLSLYANTAGTSTGAAGTVGDLTEVVRLGDGAAGSLYAPKLLTGLANAANDSAAATAGVAVNQLYRNSSVVMIRVT